MAAGYPTTGLFQGSNFGAPGQNSVVYQTDTGILGGESSTTKGARDQHMSGLMTPQKKEEERKQSSNNLNRNQFQQQPATTGSTTPAPTGSSLVAGGPGTGMAASYGTNFGLQGAVSAGGLGSYGGATGLMSGTAAGSGAGWSGLGAASSGMTYGGAGAASGASAGSAGWGSLASASQGMTYGGSAFGSAAGAGAAGGAGAGGAAAGAGSAGAGSSMTAAVMSNPWTAIIAAIVGSANYLHNKDISPWSETLQGKGGGNMLDYYGGRNDGKTHGFMGKIFDKDGATGQSAKSLTDFSELDFSNGFKNLGKAWGSIFKGKFF